MAESDSQIYKYDSSCNNYNNLKQVLELNQLTIAPLHNEDPAQLSHFFNLKLRASLRPPELPNLRCMNVSSLGSQDS